MDNEFIQFNTDIWGYDFTCRTCGRIVSVNGEAPLNARVAMMEQGWRFTEQGKDFIPECGECIRR